METILKRIEEINEQLPKILASDFYGSEYFITGTYFHDEEECGIETLYTAFLAELNRSISVNNVYSTIASSCEDGKIWSLFSISCSPEHYRSDLSRQRTLHRYHNRWEAKEVKRPKYVVPVGLGVTDSETRKWYDGYGTSAKDLNNRLSPALVESFRDFVSANNQNDLNKFKISFNEWYQTFIQGVLQKSDYFQTPKLLSLASRIWSRYCDYIEFRESDELRQSIIAVQALIDERTRLVLEWREEDKRNKIKISMSVFAVCTLFWVAFFWYFFHIVVLVLGGCIAFTNLAACWGELCNTRNTNVSDKYVRANTWWPTSIDRESHHPCRWY